MSASDADSGPGASIFSETAAVANRSASAIGLPVMRFARYAPKVVSPRPVRPDRLRALTGQVKKSLPS